MYECRTEKLTIDGLPYELFKVDSDFDREPEKILLIIPGLPGYIPFNETYSKCLYEELRGSHAIWVISYCRFCEKDCDADILAYRPLEFEIEHKLKFLENQIPKAAQVIMLGHSIGAYMVLSLLQLLKGNKKRQIFSPENAHRPELVSYSNLSLYNRIVKCYLLFPTIERIQESPNGRKSLPTLKYFQPFWVFNMHVISKLPLWMREKLVAFLAPKDNLDPTMRTEVATFLTPRNVRNILAMAMDEFKSVTSLDEDSIKQSLDKIVIYYGSSDGWCPLSYRDDLLSRIPAVQNHLDEHKIPHIFNLCHSALMASIIAKHIKCQKF